jgi:PAS domain S-box-containing protein
VDVSLNSPRALTRRVRVIAAARRSTALRYAFAVVASVAALALTSWARAVVGSDPFLFLYASVTLSAWYGGLGAGLLATLLTVLGADALLMPPPHSVFGILDPAEALRIAVFILVAALVSSTSESLRRASQRAQRRTDEAARLAEELRENAAELERQVAESRALATALAAARWAAEASERRYRLLFQESPLPAWIYDVETLGFLDVNETAVRHYGWSREEFLSMTVRDVRPPDELSHFERAAQETRSGWTRNRGSFVHRRKDGSRFAVEVSTQELDLPGRRARLALVTDVTERVHLLDAERRARADAEQANRAKLEFLATMSHELRTPLNAIGGYAQLLDMELRGPVTDQQREDLARIQRSQRHLLSLINDVLNFARIETGHVHYAIAPLALADVLADVADLVTPQARAKGLTCELAVPDRAVLVRADRDKLVQVVVNLLSNAVKFTPAGGRVALACAAAGDAVEVRVSDTGIGIATDKLETIFEPFVQVDRGYTRTTEGAGLGLAISRDLARAMGGDICAESDVGKGSCFVLRLPRG